MPIKSGRILRVCDVAFRCNVKIRKGLGPQVAPIKRWEEIIICQSALPIDRNVAASDSDAEYFAEQTDKERVERLRSGLSAWEYDRLHLNKPHHDFDVRTGQHINFARIARSHLGNLSKSLIEGAESRAWSKEQAFDVYRHRVFGASYRYLELTYQVWRNSRSSSLAPKSNWYQLSDMAAGFDLPTIPPNRPLPPQSK